MTTRILLVEDEPVLRELLCEVLSRAGYAVQSAAHGKAAMQLISKQPVDLVVTDLIMPEQEGVETILALRKVAPRLPIIAMSGGGFASPGTHLRIARTAGADRVLYKPFDSEELLSAVNGLLAAGIPVRG